MAPSLRSQDDLVKEVRRRGPFRTARSEAAGLVTSFNYAFEGIIYVVRTQRNMRIHFIVTLGVLPLGVLLGVSRIEMLALILAVAFVLLMEMANTALEMTIDVATPAFDPPPLPTPPRGRSPPSRRMGRSAGPHGPAARPPCR